MKGKKTGGRQAGTPNKVTSEFRATVQSLLDDNKDNFALWVQQVASSDPGRALALVTNLAEFAAPKLARHEHTGKDGEALTVRMERADGGLL